ncbi:MAG: ABC transporter permease [Firmicutes bacterium]|nr:ABC transporter permease [Bacillota bacterium]
MQSAIAIKEFRDIFRNKTFVTILGLLLLMSLVTVILGSAQVHQKVDAYQQSIEFLKSLGRTELPPMPNLNPIAVSKNFVNYIGMMGALLAMILGYNAFSKERKNGTLNLILSRPIYRDQVINGKILGNTMVLVTIIAAIGVSTLAFIGLTSGVTLSWAEVIKMLLFFFMSLLYLLIFFSLALWLSIKVPTKNNAILLTIIIWLVFAFIFPQVGDTMDLDNQLPGGFFAQMGMTKTQAHHSYWYK